MYRYKYRSNSKKAYRQSTLAKTKDKTYENIVNNNLMTVCTSTSILITIKTNIVYLTEKLRKAYDNLNVTQVELK